MEVGFTQRITWYRGKKNTKKNNIVKGKKRKLINKDKIKAYNKIT